MHHHFYDSQSTVQSSKSKQKHIDRLQIYSVCKFTKLWSEPKVVCLLNGENTENINQTNIYFSVFRWDYPHWAPLSVPFKLVVCPRLEFWKGKLDYLACSTSCPTPVWVNVREGAHPVLTVHLCRQGPPTLDLSFPFYFHKTPLYRKVHLASLCFRLICCQLSYYNRLC